MKTIALNNYVLVFVAGIFMFFSLAFLLSQAYAQEDEEDNLGIVESIASLSENDPQSVSLNSQKTKFSLAIVDLGLITSDTFSAGDQFLPTVTVLDENGESVLRDDNLSLSFSLENIETKEKYNIISNEECSGIKPCTRQIPSDIPSGNYNLVATLIEEDSQFTSEPYIISLGQSANLELDPSSESISPPSVTTCYGDICPTQQNVAVVPLDNMYTSNTIFTSDNTPENMIADCGENCLMPLSAIYTRYLQTDLDISKIDTSSLQDPEKAQETISCLDSTKDQPSSVLSFIASLSMIADSFSSDPQAFPTYNLLIDSLISKNLISCALSDLNSSDYQEFGEKTQTFDLKNKVTGDFSQVEENYQFEGFPVIIKTRYQGSEPHYTVLTGITNNYVWIIDPLDPNQSGNYGLRINKQEFIDNYYDNEFFVVNPIETDLGDALKQPRGSGAVGLEDLYYASAYSNLNLQGLKSYFDYDLSSLKTPDEDPLKCKSLLGNANLLSPEDFESANSHLEELYKNDPEARFFPSYLGPLELVNLDQFGQPTGCKLVIGDNGPSIYIKQIYTPGEYIGVVKTGGTILPGLFLFPANKVEVVKNNLLKDDFDTNGRLSWLGIRAQPDSHSDFLPDLNKLGVQKIRLKLGYTEQSDIDKAVPLLKQIKDNNYSVVLLTDPRNRVPEGELEERFNYLFKTLDEIGIAPENVAFEIGNEYNLHLLYWDDFEPLDSDLRQSLTKQELQKNLDIVYKEIDIFVSSLKEGSPPELDYDFASYRLKRSYFRAGGIYNLSSILEELNKSKSGNIITPSEASLNKLNAAIDRTNEILKKGAGPGIGDGRVNKSIAMFIKSAYKIVQKNEKYRSSPVIAGAFAIYANGDPVDARNQISNYLDALKNEFPPSELNNLHFAFHAYNSLRHGPEYGDYEGDGIERIYEIHKNLIKEKLNRNQCNCLWLTELGLDLAYTNSLDWKDVLIYLNNVRKTDGMLNSVLVHELNGEDINTFYRFINEKIQYPSYDIVQMLIKQKDIYLPN